MDIPTFEELFELINLNGWVIGLDGVNLHLRFYILGLILFPMIFEEAGYLVTKATAANFVKILGLIPCITYCILAVLKILAVVINRVKMMKLMNSVELLYLNIAKDEKKRNIVRREIVMVKILSKYFFVLNMMLVCVYNFSSLIIIPYYYVTTNTVIYHLPFPIIVPFSTDAWLPWFVVYIHSISCGFICVIYLTTVDALYFILVTHVSVNFMVLREDFLQLKSNNFNNLKECIQNHQYLIQLSEDLDGIFRLPNFINVFFGSIQICVLGFCITVGEWSDLPGYFLFLSTVLAQIWMMSAFGEDILSKSVQINNAVWNCYWDCADVKTQKIILTILMRSQKPQKLTAYLFSTICCSSFRKILSNAWSYFSILRTVYRSPEVDNS